MNKDDRQGGYTPARATRFYVPLLLQAFSQSLTYPLVAAIVTHGAFGVHGLTAFAQGQTVMFMIGALGGGLVMTGMVFARTLPGYLSFKKLNFRMMVALLSVQCLLCVHPFDALIFQTLLKLPADLAAAARVTMFWGFIMQGAFFLRNVPLVALFNARAATEANIATLARIALTAAFSPLFIATGLVGPAWGLVALTIPCVLELVLTWLFARKYVAALPLHDPSRPVAGGRPAPFAASVATQFAFTVPLSFGGLLLATAPFMIAAFVGRSAGADVMLSIHYVTIGLANPVGYAALRMQAVAIAFPPEREGDHRMLGFSVVAGLLLGLIPLMFLVPGLSEWYFHTVQNVPEENVWMARWVIGLYALLPVVQTVRGHAEGTAAWLKRPNAILAGQAVNLASLVVTLFVTLSCGMAGWLMGVTAILVATLMTVLTVRLGILLARLEDRFGEPIHTDSSADC